MTWSRQGHLQMPFAEDQHPIRYLDPGREHDLPRTRCPHPLYREVGYEPHEASAPIAYLSNLAHERPDALKRVVVADEPVEPAGDKGEECGAGPTAIAVSHLRMPSSARSASSWLSIDRLIARARR